MYIYIYAIQYNIKYKKYRRILKKLIPSGIMTRFTLLKGSTEFKLGYLIRIHFLIKSLRIEPCFIERKTRFIL